MCFNFVKGFVCAQENAVIKGLEAEKNGLLANESEKVAGLRAELESVRALSEELGSDLAREGEQRRALSQQNLDLISELAACQLRTGVEPVYEAPKWLDKTKTAYQPKQYYNNVYVTLQHSDVYTNQSRALQNLVESRGWKKLKTVEAKAQAVWEYVCTNYRYDYDKEENWQFPATTFHRGKGDCVANSERIYVKEGVKTVGDLKIGDEILSYDFNARKYCYKPVTKIWEKGKLPIKRVHLRNGSWVNITSDQNLWVRFNQKTVEYAKTKLSEVDLTRWWKRKVPTALKIPYEVKDAEWLDEDLCWVIGHYLADGYSDSGHTSISGDRLEKVIEVFEAHEIPFSERPNNHGVPQVFLRKSEFKDYLARFGANAYEKHVEKEIFHLPENKLQSLLNGYLAGDGHVVPTSENQGNREYVYSTVSERLKNDLARLHFQLGKPVHSYLCVNHGGFGKNPVWRSLRNSNSTFTRDHGFAGLGETSISFIEDLEDAECRDFEVENTHTFVFADSGLVSHQCEDTSILFIALLRAIGVPPTHVFNALGQWSTYGGHSYPVVQHADGDWYVYETTLNNASTPKRWKGSDYHAGMGLANWIWAGRLKEGDQV